MKPKIVHILNHCSTGGLPTYALKRVEALKNDYDIFVIEYQNLSDEYVIHRKKFQAILSDNYFILGEDKLDLLKIIAKIDPDFIIFEEIPELFCHLDYAKLIYSKRNRKYKIIECTHTSTFDTKNKIFLPDKFLFVSKYSQDQYKHFNIPSEVIEYPVEKITVTTEDKSSALKELKLNPAQKHIVITGLFTPNKNQKYAFDLARRLDNKYQFHFLGNLAPNFKDYWEPLLKNKPQNCIIHGETDKVDIFLKAADLFLFPSLLELNPIALKEAISFDLKCLIYKLPTYSNCYDLNPNIKYLSGYVSIDSSKIKILV